MWTSKETGCTRGADDGAKVMRGLREWQELTDSLMKRCSPQPLASSTLYPCPRANVEVQTHATRRHDIVFSERRGGDSGGSATTDGKVIRTKFFEGVIELRAILLGCTG